MAYVDTLGDILRVTIAVMHQNNQLQENNWCFVNQVSGGGDTRAALGGRVLGLYNSFYLALLPPSSILYGYKVSLLNRKPPPLPAIDIVSTMGTGANPVAPTQARPICRLTTLSAGRAYRGRIFFPTPQVSSVSAAGAPAAAVTTAMDDIAGPLVTPFSSGGSTWALVIAHRAKGPPVTWTSTPVTGEKGQTVFATQWKSGGTGKINVNPW